MQYTIFLSVDENLCFRTFIYKHFAAGAVPQSEFSQIFAKILTAFSAFHTANSAYSLQILRVCYYEAVAYEFHYLTRNRLFEKEGIHFIFAINPLLTYVLRMCQ